MSSILYIPEPPILPSDYNPFPHTYIATDPLASYAADCRRGQIEKAEAAKKAAEKEAKRVAEVKEKVMNLTEEEKETLKQRYGSHLCPRSGRRFNHPLNRPSGLTEEEADFNVLLKVQGHERRMEAKKAEEEQKAFEAEQKAFKAEVQRRVELELYERRVRAEVEERLAQEEKSSKSAIL
jgi:hypothetical protein